MKRRRRACILRSSFPFLYLLSERARESACIKMCVGQVSGHCSSAGDLKDAVATCKHLDIPLKQVNTRIFLTLSPHDTFSGAK